MPLKTFAYLFVSVYIFCMHAVASIFFVYYSVCMPQCILNASVGRFKLPPLHVYILVGASDVKLETTLIKLGSGLLIAVTCGNHACSRQ